MSGLTRALCPAGHRAWSAILLCGLCLLADCAGPATPTAPSAAPPRVGYLSATSSASRTAEAFRAGLAELGYVEGQNLVVEWRFADDQLDRLPALAAELAAMPVAVIVVGSTPAIRAARAATDTIPIVMGVSADPVEQGFVASLARPGGNVTGLTSISLELSAKRLEVLRDAFPALQRVGVLWNPANPAKPLEWQDTVAAAPVLGVRVVSLEARDAAEMEAALELAERERVEALVVLGDPIMTSQQARIRAFATRQRVPDLWETPENVEAGALLAYGPNRDDLFRRAAYYVDRILKGAQPADLPVERPTRFFLAVNFRTAEATGLDLSPTLLREATIVVR